MWYSTINLDTLLDDTVAGVEMIWLAAIADVVLCCQHIETDKH